MEAASGKKGPDRVVDPSMTVANPEAGTVTMFSTSWCGYCRRLKLQLDAAGVVYDEVNIERDPEAAEFVENVNAGNRTVPTVRFPDGSALTNPSMAEVSAKLDALAA